MQNDLPNAATCLIRSENCGPWATGLDRFHCSKTCHYWAELNHTGDWIIINCTYLKQLLVFYCEFGCIRQVGFHLSSPTRACV